MEILKRLRLTPDEPVTASRPAQNHQIR